MRPTKYFQCSLWWNWFIFKAKSSQSQWLRDNPSIHICNDNIPEECGQNDKTNTEDRFVVASITAVRITTLIVVAKLCMNTITTLLGILSNDVWVHPTVHHSIFRRYHQLSMNTSAVKVTTCTREVTSSASIAEKEYQVLKVEDSGMAFCWLNSNAHKLQVLIVSIGCLTAINRIVLRYASRLIYLSIVKY